MKIQHLAIIFLIIILPFSIMCRSTMFNYSSMLKDQVRLNNVIDSATQDALDMLVELNDEFQMIYFNERFDINQTIAEEAVKSFFQTLAINFNMPYIYGDTEAYFSMYVPALVIVAYDGFFIYSVEDSGNGFSYTMSPKIPYAYFDEASGTLVHFTLGNYITLFTRNKIYAGELTCNYKNESLYSVYKDEIGGYTPDVLDFITQITNDMSVIVDGLNELSPGTGQYVPKFLIPGPSGDPNTIPLLQDYQNTDFEVEASEFHKIRRKTIINVIRETLQEEMNEHTTYASLLGSSYDYALPEIPTDDWSNSIDDISIMSFIQGMPIGTNMYYDNYALSGSRIIQTEYYYGSTDKYYHHETCPLIEEHFENPPPDLAHDPVDNIFLTREQAATANYFPCNTCCP